MGAMTISCDCADCGMAIDRSRDRFACATCFERRAGGDNPTRCLMCVIRHRYEAHPDVPVVPERIDDDLMAAIAIRAQKDPIMRRTLELAGWGTPPAKLWDTDG